MSTIVNPGRVRTVAQDTRNFVDRPRRTELVRIRGSLNAVQNLTCFVDAGYHAQFTPSNNGLSGLYALAISLRPIIEGMLLPPVSFEQLQAIYTSKHYHDAVYQHASISTTSVTGMPNHAAAAFRFQQIINQTTLDFRALMRVLELLEQSLPGTLSLGVCTPVGVQNDGRMVYEAVIHDGPLANVPVPPGQNHVVWILNSGGQLNHWEGLGLQPLYQDPTLPQRHARPQPPPIISGRERRNTQPIVGRRPSTPSTRSNSQQEDPVRKKEEYPKHLTADELITQYRDEIFDENFLWCHLHLEQKDMLSKLVEAGITIAADTLRKRKQSAIENRVKRENPELTPELYKRYAEEYKKEQELKGLVKTRKIKQVRPTSVRPARRNSESSSTADSSVHAVEPFARPSLKQQPAPVANSIAYTGEISQSSAERPTSETQNQGKTTNRGHHRSKSTANHRKNGKGKEKVNSESKEANNDLWRSHQLVLDADFADAHYPHKLTAFPENWCMPDDWEPAVDYPQSSMSAGAIPRTFEDYFNEPLRYDPPVATANLSDDQIGSMLQAETAGMPQLPPQSGDMSAFEVRDFFRKANRNFESTDRTIRGPGVGPPGPLTTFVWEQDNSPQNLTMEQIDWYLKRPAAFDFAMIRQLCHMKARKLNEMDGRNWDGDEFGRVIELDEAGLTRSHDV